MKTYDLFNGHDLDNWVSRKTGGKAEWNVHDGIMTIEPGTGDIYTKEEFGDFMLHAEFCCPVLYGEDGVLKRGNSGIYLQGAYEIQVINSYDRGEVNGQFCGSVYQISPPRENASTPPGTWQTYDIIFRAAKLGENGEVVSPAAVTIIHNGVVIQNNVEFDKATPSGINDHPVERGPIMLQAHNDIVHFRNIRITEL